MIQRTIQFFDSNLEHTNGYWAGKRSRLFHSRAINNEILPLEDHEKNPIPEFEVMNK